MHRLPLHADAPGKRPLRQDGQADHMVRDGAGLGM